MDGLFPTLFSKTFSILTLQLIITWVACTMTVGFYRSMYYVFNKNWAWLTYNARKEPNIHISSVYLWVAFIPTIIASAILFYILLKGYRTSSLESVLFFFGMWSITNGILVGICLIDIDENLGKRALGITATIVALTASVGLSTSADLAAWQNVLFTCLSVLLFMNFIRLFIAMSNAFHALTASAGAILFTLYLIFDFNLLKKKQQEGLNDWTTAVDM
ncbi:MAG: Bax inhibitor-1 family protein, partial [Alphaproteobacteria bacterium]|nr:Bax inhibitor-1 family protein [Alphaproteobacteria bacterium]